MKEHMWKYLNIKKINKKKREKESPFYKSVKFSSNNLSVNEVPQKITTFRF